MQTTEWRRAGRTACFLFLFALPLFVPGATNAQAVGTASFKLIGTIAGRGFDGAVFQDSGGKQIFCQVNEALPDGSKIIKVREDSITLRDADGNAYDMYIAHDTKSAAVAAEPQARQAPIVQRTPLNKRSYATKRDRRRHVRGSASSDEE